MWSNEENMNGKAKEFYERMYSSDLYQCGYSRVFNRGYYPIDPILVDTVPTGHSDHDHMQWQLYYELLKLPRVRSILKRSTEGSKIRLLDIGCGVGGGLQFLAQALPNIELVGIDINSSAIELAKKAKGTPKFYVRSADNLDSIGGPFDLILCVESAGMIHRGQETLDQVRKQLKLNGVLLIADFCKLDAPLDQNMVSCLAHQGDEKGFQLVNQRNVSFNVAMSCKQNSKAIRKQADRYLESDFVAEFLERSCDKKTPVYEQLRLGTMGYFLQSFECTESILDIEIDDDSDEEIDDHDLPNYYDYKEVFPELQILKDEFLTIRQELHSVMSMSWPNWPEEHYQRPGSDWKVLPFCYTFPADDPSRTVWIDATCDSCPALAAILKRIPSIRTALFSRLGPDTELGFHRGWADLSNHILRCHLGLDIPAGDTCAMVVGGQVQHHKTGEILVFDDSKLHKAYNNSTETRVILIVDLFRPEDIPRGRAVGSHTTELDEFISKFGLRPTTVEY